MGGGSGLENAKEESDREREVGGMGETGRDTVILP